MNYEEDLNCKDNANKTIMTKKIYNLNNEPTLKLPGTSISVRTTWN